MNKKLFEKVKGLCKDTGLSEKYLKAITEKMGGSIEDDSTDDEAIESTANLIAEVAKESQGEATRWANKKKPTQTEDEEEEERKRKEEESKRKGKVALDEATEKRLKEMEEKIANYEAKESKEARAKEVVKAMESTKSRLISVTVWQNQSPMMKILRMPFPLTNRSLLQMGLMMNTQGVLRRQVKSKLMKLLIACWNQ